jgi:fermentation-respiration switch protein FrsA (DUF1100 family)
VVPPQDSRELHEMAREPKRLVELPDADHVFSESHTTKMVGAVTAWIRESWY